MSNSKHTKGPWRVNHWTNGKSGVSCIETKGGVSYFSGDAVHSDYYNIVSKINPMDHSIQGSFEGAHIAEIHDFKCQDGGKESLANAKLIASAPELLEALRRVVRHGLIENEEYDHVIGIVNSAIQKAIE